MASGFQADGRAGALSQRIDQILPILNREEKAGSGFPQFIQPVGVTAAALHEIIMQSQFPHLMVFMVSVSTVYAFDDPAQTPRDQGWIKHSARTAGMGAHSDAVFFFDQPEQFLGMKTFRQIIPGAENEKIPFRGVIFHAEDHAQAVCLKTLLYVRLRGHVIVIRDADAVKPTGTRVGEDLTGG